MSVNQQNQPQTTSNREQETDSNTQRSAPTQADRTNDTDETTDDATTEGIPSTEERP